MKKALLIAAIALLYVLVAFAMCQEGWAQSTTYTVTQDSCGGKAVMFCQLQTDQGPVVIDNRNVAGNLYLGAWGTVDPVHGAYSFPINPDGSKNDFDGAGSFLSDDQQVSAVFEVHAHYVTSCSGRGCGGTLGWHYTIKTGSTITVQ